MFRGLNSGFEATRYHSLIVKRETLPDNAGSHRDIRRRAHHGPFFPLGPSLPGVQFHPQSIASENGHALLQNFLKTADARFRLLQGKRVMDIRAALNKIAVHRGI